MIQKRDVLEMVLFVIAFICAALFIAYVLEEVGVWFG